MADRGGQRAQRAFGAAQQAWGKALAAHRLAPPDAGFSGRLEALAAAAKAETDACRAASAAGFAWPPHRASSSEPPYELRPGTGRRGPPDLWRAFDSTVSELNMAARTTNLLDVAQAYEGLALVAAKLAEAVEREDRANGQLPGRRRRSA
jgi:hypothetical protein